MTEKTKTICVVGAGLCGLTAIKACLENNLFVTCYEKTSSFGGSWKYRDVTINGVGSIMKSTVAVTSKEMSAFSDFPPPRFNPNYMDHTLVMAYLEEYAQSFRLLDHIQFSTEVVNVEKHKEYIHTGQWTVTIEHSSGQFETETFDAVMICIGSFVYPYIPSLTGLSTFKGRILHSNYYKEPSAFTDKKTLVVGIGVSGTNIATELSHTGQKLPIYLSTRRGAWIIPRLADGGLPWDILYSRRYLNILFSRFLPKAFVADYFEHKANHKMDHGLYKLKPNYRIIERNSTIEDNLSSQIMTGAIKIKGEIDHFVPQGVVFKDEPGLMQPLDVVILATGFQPKIPIIDETILKLSSERVELFQFVFPHTIPLPTLAIIGMVQPNGSIGPIAEMQARWVARIFAGQCKLPTQKQMQANPYETDWTRYMDCLAKYIGVKPPLLKMMVRDPKLFYTCFFGPTAAYQFRLIGPNSWPKARETILTIGERAYDFDVKSHRDESINTNESKLIVHFDTNPPYIDTRWQAPNGNSPDGAEVVQHPCWFISLADVGFCVGERICECVSFIYIITHECAGTV
uniref:Flavin-containing monooxygenase n=1 Tax=Strigamia maritima TaxID=126957 RepID=T1JA49_STRMM